MRSIAFTAEPISLESPDATTGNTHKKTQGGSVVTSPQGGHVYNGVLGVKKIVPPKSNLCSVVFFIYSNDRNASI